MQQDHCSSICTDDGSSSYRNVYEMSLTTFSLAVIFINKCLIVSSLAEIYFVSKLPASITSFLHFEESHTYGYLLSPKVRLILYTC